MNNAAAKTPAKVTCPACNGRRYINGFESIADGICFTCNGSGVVSINHRAARAEVLTPAQIEARAEAAKLGARMNAFFATFAGMDMDAVADKLSGLSNPKLDHVRSVTFDNNAPGAAELHAGAHEVFCRRGLSDRRRAA